MTKTDRCEITGLPIAHDAPTPKNFWSYQAGRVPRVDDLPPGAFKGTQEQFEQLSPGMRREIERYAKQRLARQIMKHAGTP